MKLCFPIYSAFSTFRIMVCFAFICLFLSQIKVMAEEQQLELNESQVSELASQSQNSVVDKIITIVNNDVLTESELKRDFSWYRIYYPEQLYGMSEQEALLYIMNKKTDQLLLIQEIQKTQFVTIPKNEVDLLFERVSGRFGSAEILESVLARIHFSKNEFYQYLWTELLIEQYMQQKFKPRVRVTNTEIIDFLSKNYREYGLEENEIEEVDKAKVAQVHEIVKAKLIRNKSTILMEVRIKQLKSEADIKNYLIKP